MLQMSLVQLNTVCIVVDQPCTFFLYDLNLRNILFHSCIYIYIYIYIYLPWLGDLHKLISVYIIPYVTRSV